MKENEQSPDKSLVQKAKKIKALLFDVDGVLTRGEIMYLEGGKEIKMFHVIDGHRIKIAQRYGMEIYFMTGRQSKVVAHRAAELKIDGIYQGALKKGEVLQQFLEEHDFQLFELAFLGDDLIDIPVLRKVGLAGAVANACPEVKEIAHYITEKKGGEGAAGEFIELILKAQGHWQHLMDFYYSS